MEGPHAAQPPMESPFTSAAQQPYEGSPRAQAQQGDRSWQDDGAPLVKAEGPQLTFRALFGGVLVGGLLCCSNTYFGLQTGWVTMGSLQSAVLGFGAFRLLSRWGCAAGFSVGENVILQTTSVATATMPLAAGLVGIIPALGMLSPGENPPGGAIAFSAWQLLLWALSLAFLGVFLAVPLRTQTIVKEKLRFPSGTATAQVIRTLHGVEAPEGLPEGLSTIQEEEGPLLPVTSRRGDSGLRDRASSWQGHGRPRGSHAPPGGSHAPPGGWSCIHEDEPLIASPGSEEVLALRKAASHNPRLDLQALDLLARADSGLARHSFRARTKSVDGRLSQCLLVQASSAAGYSPEHSLVPGHHAAKEDAGGEGDGARSTASSAASSSSQEWNRAWGALLGSFGGAGAYTLAAAALPPLKSLPVLSWLGWGAATAWGWTLDPSLGYVGQGMIMGPKTALSMLLGAFIGYAGLGPHARRQGWAPGAISDWRAGAAGWVLWVSLAIMLGDSLTSLGLLTAASLRDQLRLLHRGRQKRAADGEVCPPGEQIPAAWWVLGLLGSGAFCTAVLTPLMGLPFWQPIAAMGLALLVALLAVRALGQTDLNPVSGVGKLSQVVFALLAPGQVVPNLVAGAIAEAGAQQAGDMMQDFKTAHLLGVCPRAQFVAMLLGSAASVVVSVGAYRLYTTAWEVPSPTFPAPTALIWLDMAQLVSGGHLRENLPAHVLPFCAWAAGLAALLPLGGFLLQRTLEAAEAVPWEKQTWRQRAARVVETLLPSGIGIAVGMYVAPKWTIPRVIGSLFEQAWRRLHPQQHSRLMVMVASGLVLGEGTASIFTALGRAVLGQRGG